MMHDQTFYLAHYTDRLSYYLQAGHMQHAKQYFDQLPQQVLKGKADGQGSFIRSE